MMTIREIYTYSWFANLSYVDWRNEAVGSNYDADIAIQDEHGKGSGLES